MASRFWSSVLIPGVALIFFALCDEGGSVAVPGKGMIDLKCGAFFLPETIMINRKLKENHDDTARIRKMNEAKNDELIEQDYPEFDPSPSTKPAIKSGPIVHDTSIMPSIPRSGTPDHPTKGHP